MSSASIRTELVITYRARSSGLVTNERIFRTPTPLAEALAFADAVRSHPNAVRITAGRVALAGI